PGDAADSANQSLRPGRRGRGVGLTNPPDHHPEFVTAEPTDNVGGPDAGDELARQRLQEGVTGGVAMAVVDRFKAVEIDKHQRRMSPITLYVRERAFELAFKAPTIENIQQRINVGTRL